jgi:D-tyrosyl-tRNA(Tyr) deacylase
MRALIQRVKSAKVSVGNSAIAECGRGIVVLLGIGIDDTLEETIALAEKITNLRIFEDEQGKTNRSILEIDGEAIVVSQFTLYADTRKGRRPSFLHAAAPELAEPMVLQLTEELRSRGIRTQTGKFGEHMLVEINNDGPFTIWLEN